MDAAPRHTDAGPKPPGLATRGLTVHFGSRCALRDVSLDVPAGRITAIVGPSGCGKSTFLATLNRLADLLPDCRVAGTVRLGGEDVLAPATDPVALRRRVGTIFQHPNPFPFSIRKNLAFPLKEHGVRDRTEQSRRAEQALREVGLWDEVCDRLEAPAPSLSGGQQQRLCIARALVLAPEVLLFDEPCSALDPLSSAVVEDLIAGLRGRYTVVAVTHNLAQARRISDHAALFWHSGEAGCLVEAAPTARLFDAPRHRITAAYVTGARG